MSVLYSEANVSPGTTYANTAALQAVNTTTLQNGVRVQVTGSGVYQFYLQATSGNVQPTTGPGYWKLVTDPYVMMSASNQIDGSQVALSDSLSLNDGTAAAPTFNYAADLTTGLYRVGASQIGVTTGGTLRATFSTTALTLASGIALVGAAGTVGAPAVAIGETGTGFYQTAAHQIGISINGGLVATLAATTFTLPSTVTLVMSAPGANGVPTIAIGEAVSGFYASASHQVALAINSATTWIQTATQFQMQSGIAILSAVGAVSTPAVAIGETATGLYQTAAHQIGFACNGVLAATLSGTSLTMASAVGLVMTAAAIQLASGGSVASASTITLGQGGNVFTISGTTTINLITSTGWQTGSVVTLLFGTTITIKNNQAPSGAGAAMLLSGASDMSAIANSSLTLVYNGTAWVQIAQSVY